MMVVVLLIAQSDDGSCFAEDEIQIPSESPPLSAISLSTSGQNLLTVFFGKLAIVPQSSFPPMKGM